MDRTQEASRDPANSIYHIHQIYTPLSKSLNFECIIIGIGIATSYNIPAHICNVCATDAT